MKIFFLALLIFLSSKTQAETGKFQISSQGDNMYLLDTNTGRVWEKFCFRKYSEKGMSCKIQAWKEMQVIGLNSTMKKLEESSGADADWREKYRNIK